MPKNAGFGSFVAYDISGCSSAMPTRTVLRVHGISGIKDSREFNNPLELVRTMPG